MGFLTNLSAGLAGLRQQMGQGLQQQFHGFAAAAQNPAGYAGSFLPQLQPQQPQQPQDGQAAQAQPAAGALPQQAPAQGAGVHWVLPQQTQAPQAPQITLPPPPAPLQAQPGISRGRALVNGTGMFKFGA